MHAQIGQRGGQLLRMNGIGRQRPALVKRPAGAVVVVGNHHAVDRFGRMAGPPADHDAAQIVLVEDVPSPSPVATMVAVLSRRTSRRTNWFSKDLPVKTKVTARSTIA